MTLTQGPIPPPKHLIENEPQFIPLWWGARKTIYDNCAKRPPVLPRHLSLVYVERKEAS